MLTLLIIAANILALGCAPDKEPAENWFNRKPGLPAHNENRITIKSGIAGTVTLIEGNCMPGANANCTKKPVKRRIRIYKYTSMSQAKASDDGLFSDVSTELITITESSNEGLYQAEVPPGQYSIFIEEEGKLYANDFDANMGINPVIIPKTGIVKMNLTLTKAAY